MELGDCRLDVVVCRGCAVDGAGGDGMNDARQCRPAQVALASSRRFGLARVVECLTASTGADERLGQAEPRFDGPRPRDAIGQERGHGRRSHRLLDQVRLEQCMSEIRRRPRVAGIGHRLEIVDDRENEGEVARAGRRHHHVPAALGRGLIVAEGPEQVAGEREVDPGSVDVAPPEQVPAAIVPDDGLVLDGADTDEMLEYLVVEGDRLVQSVQPGGEHGGGLNSEAREQLGGKVPLCGLGIRQGILWPSGENVHPHPGHQRLAENLVVACELRRLQRPGDCDVGVGHASLLQLDRGQDAQGDRPRDVVGREGQCLIGQPLRSLPVLVEGQGGPVGQGPGLDLDSTAGADVGLDLRRRACHRRSMAFGLLQLLEDGAGRIRECPRRIYCWRRH